ncbi:RecB family exonuclease [Kribbella sp. NPDC058245]|uniref:RecB family exonuclease n=1 Tax=Kribbella sp. NPDC058245 TaxID=3346399 RepID=UPI0036EECEFB
MSVAVEVPVNGHPRGALSPSRAADFMSCPLKYRFRVVDRLPEKPSSAAVRGTVVHGVLERLFDLPRGQRTLEHAAEMLEPQWQEVLAAEPEVASLFAEDASGEELASWLAEAHKLLGKYFTLEDPNALEPAERELYVETALESGLVLRGYVDRLDVAPTGEIRVVDYKTGRSPSEFFEAKALFQMKFYALVLWRLRGVVPAMLQLVYLGNGEIVRYVPDEADLRACERKVTALWAAISHALESGDWRPSKGPLCDWCDYKSLCPAWGGTPPPLPQRTVEEVVVESAGVDLISVDG